MSTTETTAAIPGIFYRAPAPEKPPYVLEGEAVEAGQVIGLVEIMKQFSEVTASASGTVVSFAIDNGAMLSPGQTIAVIETS